MRIKSQRDFWSGVMFILIGVGFAIGATNYSMGTSARPGAGYFPLGLGAILAILGLILLIESMVVEALDGERIGAVAWRPLSIIIGGIIFFGFALDRLGLFITFPLLVVIVSFASDEFKWRGVIINAIVLTIGAWAIFVLGLKLIIPVLPRFMLTP
ncbi:tripartite tricarboxylate transporter TctB family protein [Piscinibacter koreensis]|uniref:Tripartite tricarboxylate transporter TctB family protein n=1 Tax=Piscinibacter koreensis TaxID=2742824 RepID=A0A7Y6TXI6_9BURK|nr:tripartite tricarboxylate transporter TctB family protein [Schlegelella koreensis]NUZ07203.1 tripartite tricarboxylate transporter TctB family protein [Schlegelella koreensis]